jgi:hypothetical protein
MEVSLENTLEVDVNITLTLEVPRGFTIVRGDIYELTPGETKDGFLVLNSSGAEKGNYKLTINVSDSYGRFQLVQVQLNVKEEVIDGPEDDGKDEGLPLPLIIGIALGLLLLIVIIVVVVMKRKKPEEEEEEEEEEDDHLSLEYDPTGKVADGGSGVESAVPLAPGLISGDEEEMRKRGSRTVELKIPSKKKEEEIDEELMKPYKPPEEEEEEEYEEDEMEELSDDELAEELYGHIEE